MPFQYKVYGLTLRANRTIPGLTRQPPTATNPWQISLGEMSAKILASNCHESALYVSSKRSDDDEPTWKISCVAETNFLRFRFCDSTDFVVDPRGQRIWVTWAPPLTVEDTTTYLLGPVLGFVLRLLGTTCLHASAVVIDNRAVALVGAPGAGKSTTAAAFAKLGYPVLSDDIVALSEDSGSFLAQPGYPRINLWPDSSRAICGSADPLPRITPTWEKQFLALTSETQRFQSGPLPVAAVYLFSARSHEQGAPFVDAVPIHHGLIELIGNSYANHLLDRSARADEFAVLGRLANAVPLRRLIPHAELNRLPQLCRAIVDDVRRLNVGAAKPASRSL